VAIFSGERGECFHCHVGFNFTNNGFRNDNLYAVYQDIGRAKITELESDVGKFKVPMLRGLAARAPYFHNGTAKDLKAVVDFYNGRFNIGLAGNHSDSTVTDGKRFMIWCWHIEFAHVDASAIGNKRYLLRHQGFGRLLRLNRARQERLLGGQVEGIEAAEHRVIFPLHPRTRKSLEAWGLEVPANVEVRDAVTYTEMLTLERDAVAIATDSGGVQREAYLWGVPCVTMREETEWIETVSTGWNTLVGVDAGEFRAAMEKPLPESRPPIFGDGNAAERIAEVTVAHLDRVLEDSVV